LTGDDVLARLDRLEGQLEELRLELARVTAPAQSQQAIELDATPAAVAQAETAQQPARPGSPPPRDVPASPLTSAWRMLERGDAQRALNEAFEALVLARTSGDPATLDELAVFAASAVSHTSGRTQSRAEQLAIRVATAQRTLTTEAPAPGVPPQPVIRPLEEPAPMELESPAPTPREPWIEPQPARLDRAAAWLRAELTGARAFAVAGGAVTLLGVIFLFVLAADRGWVGPGERVALGAVASLGVLAVGLALRARYGLVYAALGAVGAGIAGAYATLAAATILYGYLPSWGALLIAAGIASVGAGIALAWSSQILAGLALVGAAAAPGLVALDDGISWQGPAFALIVFAATVAVASRRRWLWLDATVAIVATAQICWLAAAAPPDDVGAVAVACAAAFVLLAAAVAWQAYGEPGLDSASATFAFAAGGVGLLCPIAVLTDDRRLGIVLLGLAVAFCVVAFAVRRWRDLAWTIGAEALLLGGVAAAFLVSGRSLTVVWALEATVLAGLAWKFRIPRFQAASLVYLAAAVVQSLAFEVVPEWPDEAFDMPRSAAPGLFVLAGASLVTGLLQPTSRADGPSLGIAAALDPLWDALVRARVTLRAALAVGAAVFLGAAVAAILSGRALTLVFAALAAALGVAAFAFGERRLQPVALGFYVAAACHALAVEASPRTLTLGPLSDPLAPVASLVALAAAAAVLAALARFEDRGIAWLGPLSGVERHLEALRRQQDQLRLTLAFLAAVASVWAVALVAVEISYSPGQVVATALWSLLGTAVVVLAARARSPQWQVVGGTIVLLSLAKSGAFDWGQLGDGAAVASLLVVSAALFVSGFVSRWANPTESAPVEAIALAAGAAAVVLAIVALERLLGHSRALGVATLVVAAAPAAAGVAPYIRRRAGGIETWLRTLANGYWAISLGAVLFAESALVLWGADGTLALWAATAASLALAWRPLEEDRMWLSGLAVVCVAAVGTLVLVNVPARLVDASQHPATGLWVLAVLIGAAWTVAITVPPLARERAQWLIGSAAALTLYGLSLGVLEVAERLSGASVETDFQRGHTALSALWGVGALALYVVGLARDRRGLRIVGLTLFGLALAKLFLYDLRTLSSITRALSFLAVGAILLAAGFFAERLVRPDSAVGSADE
jgi:uncharacterized membrane protein